jgi:hypothetical protein
MKKLFYLIILISSWSISNAQIMSDSAINSSLKEAHQYLNGNGKPLNPGKAYIMIKQLADAGSSKAFLVLGWLYEKGLGVNSDPYQALFWYEKAAKNGIVNALNKIGLLYKHGIDGKPDYEKAYEFYCKSADKNNMDGLTQKGYMLYTGLGCKQDYTAAYPLFQKAASYGQPHAMRFLGLSMRNGYGTKVNSDSAMYWLHMASKYGNGMSDDELTTSEPENADIAGSLVEKIKAAQKLIQSGTSVNKYTKVQHNVPVNNIEGSYKGWLLKYDWSGEHVVKADELNIDIVYENNELKGKWTENQTLSIPLEAMLTPNALVFKNMEYNKHDHYYKNRVELLKFEKASFKLIPVNGELYLCGDLQMYSVNRNEPAKPMYVALIKTSKSQKNSDKIISLVNEDGSSVIFKKMNAFPNPFTSILTLNFELKETCFVQTTLQTLDGKLVYSNSAGKLEAGSYTLPIQPQDLAAGTYLLTLQSGKQISTLKVIKL